jgi:hypothetical protein
MSVEWRYPAELLEALADLGLVPSPQTHPRAVRDALNGLYRYELRRLRDRFLAHQMEKPDYVGQVVGLRKKYWPLSLLPEVWERVCAPPAGVTPPAPAPTEGQC